MQEQFSWILLLRFSLKLFNEVASLQSLGKVSQIAWTMKETVSISQYTQCHLIKKPCRKLEFWLSISIHGFRDSFSQYTEQTQCHLIKKPLRKSEFYNLFQHTVLGIHFRSVKFPFLSKRYKPTTVSWCN